MKPGASSDGAFRTFPTAPASGTIMAAGPSLTPRPTLVQVAPTPAPQPGTGTIPTVPSDAKELNNWTNIWERNGRTDQEILKKVPSDHEVFRTINPRTHQEMLWIVQPPKPKKSEPKPEDLVS